MRIVTEIEMVQKLKIIMHLEAWFFHTSTFSFTAFEFRFAVPSVNEGLDKLVPDE